MKITVTSNDVAKRAGVSQSTVSRVINNYPYIREETRQKVLKTIEEMGFTPDEVARSLNKRKTATIGLIVGDISNSFFAETAKIIISEARKRGFDVILSDTDHEKENLKKSIDMLVGKRVEGIIIGSVERTEEEVERLYHSQTPVVLYNTRTDESPCDYFVLDNEKGARIAMNYLFQKQHQRIGFVSPSAKYSTLHERMEGYRQALLEKGIPYDPELVYNQPLEAEEIKKYLTSILSMPDPVTAVFAASDQIAVTLLEHCKRMNISVPEELAVIGFDDIHLSSNPFIDLTTVSQKHQVMSLSAVERLIELIQAKEKAPRHVQEIMEPELIERSTT
ncbi:LacI family transcriptional regulator [Sinobaca qinghaiensis]|uniref:LacI family transcriptional regulator n=1 Tax=Sinobaca qinghaiensis TaxID=342944 RepID=A0A419V8C7_9BACL|nr:LacI family DNA-binding transcriptional regulator [Sinobaca qinghaiensis]RKD76341.1 LacI family transcriptional regulator [Sinobaca qinghaiensis]